MRLFDWLGWIFCEIAFRSWDIVQERHWLVDWYARPFHRLGGRLYSIATRAGIRSGALVRNPRYTPEGDEPVWILANHK